MLERKERELAEAKASKKIHMDRLKKEYNISSIKAAEKKLEKLQVQHTKISGALEAQIEKLEGLLRKIDAD